jgi:hypothetical protein
MDQSNPPERPGLMKLAYFTPFDIQCAFHHDPTFRPCALSGSGSRNLSLALVGASTWAIEFASNSLTVAERHRDDAGDARNRNKLHHRRRPFMGISADIGAGHRQLLLLP